MSKGDRLPVSGGAPLGQNPFGGLRAEGLPPGPPPSPGPGPSPAEATAARNRGRVDIQRQTAGRGGKTVTVVSGFVGIGGAEKEQLAKQIQKACGAGGTVKDGCIEVQGDQREAAARILTGAGFRPVFTGG